MWRAGADVALATIPAIVALDRWIRNAGPVWAPTASICAARSACLSGRVVSCRRIRPASYAGTLAPPTIPVCVCSPSVSR